MEYSWLATQDRTTDGADRETARRGRREISQTTNVRPGQFQRQTGHTFCTCT